MSSTGRQYSGSFMSEVQFLLWEAARCGRRDSVRSAPPAVFLGKLAKGTGNIFCGFRLGFGGPGYAVIFSRIIGCGLRTSV